MNARGDLHPHGVVDAVTHAPCRTVLLNQHDRAPSWTMRGCVGWCLAVCLVAGAGCRPPQLLLSLQVEIGQAFSLQNPQGTFVVAEAGSDGSDVTPEPAACVDTFCFATMSVPRADHDITFTLNVADRCGVRGDVRILESQVRIDQNGDVVFPQNDAQDGDGPSGDPQGDDSGLAAGTSGDSSTDGVTAGGEPSPSPEATPDEGTVDNETSEGQREVTDTDVSETSPPSEDQGTQGEARPLTGIRFQTARDPVPDDDGDRIDNATEISICGRFDVPESDRAAVSCRPDDPCCRSSNRSSDQSNSSEGYRLQGQQALFVPTAPFLNKALKPFLLDATEVTWGTLRKCLAAGCLTEAPLEEEVSNQAERAATPESTPSIDAPVQGLTPTQAMAVCHWLGKRLPTDAEWLYAAAHREGTHELARYPFDVENEDDIGCRENGSAFSVNANHAKSGEDCAREPLPVGSFPSSHIMPVHFVATGDPTGGPASSVRRTQAGSSPIADLAGNVAEWTLIPPVTKEPRGALPLRHPLEVGLRGGGATVPTELLENRFVFVARTADEDTVQRLARAAGFRCAADATAETELSNEQEPTCAQE